MCPAECLCRQLPSQNTAPSRASSTRALMTSSSVLPPSPPSSAEAQNYNEVGGTKLHLFAWPLLTGRKQGPELHLPDTFCLTQHWKHHNGAGGQTQAWNFCLKKNPKNVMFIKKKKSAASHKHFFPYIMHWRLSAAKSSGETTTH